jgi:hypothetical protein
MQYSVSRQTLGLITTVFVAIGFDLVSSPEPAAAQSCSQLAQYATYYEQEYQRLSQWYQANCGSSAYCSTVYQEMQHDKAMLQYIAQLEQSSGCNSGGGGGEDPCTITRNYISKNATSSYNRIYPWVYQVLSHYWSYFQSGHLHGFYFIYETPPIYCTTNPQYTPAPRPYYATWDQALRVVTQFYNNGYFIQSAGVW